MSSPFLCLDQAEQLLRPRPDGTPSSALLAVPTETVYGLAASAFSEEGVSRIFTTKGRPASNPLILHAASLDDLLPLVELDQASPIYKRLIETFWPGPLTLLLPKGQGATRLAPQIAPSLPSLAVRLPSHPTFRELLSRVGPLVAPSANPSGYPSPTKAQHVVDDYQGKIPILASPVACEEGLESTILYLQERFDPALPRLEGPKIFFKESALFLTILRPGAISLTMLTEALEGLYEHVEFAAPSLAKSKSLEKASSKESSPKENSGKEAPLAPGLTFRHYAPKTPVVLASSGALLAPSDLLIGQEGAIYKGLSSKQILFRFDPKCSKALMRNYYDLLRQADQLNGQRLYIDDLFAQNESSSWHALRERFMRSSQGSCSPKKRESGGGIGAS